MSLSDNEFLISSKNVVHVLSIIMAMVITQIDMFLAFCPITCVLWKIICIDGKVHVFQCRMLLQMNAL